MVPIQFESSSDWVIFRLFKIYLLLHMRLFLQEQLVPLLVEDCIALDLLKPDGRRQFWHLLAIKMSNIMWNSRMSKGDV